MANRKVTKTVRASKKKLNGLKINTTSPGSWPKLPRFTADKVCLEEVPVNNLVLRVRLPGIPPAPLAVPPGLSQASIAVVKSKNNHRNSLHQTPNSVSRKLTRKTKKEMSKQFIETDCNRNDIKSPLLLPSYCLDEFVNDVFAMKLPDSAWKINIWKNQCPTVNITNNMRPERSVTFIQRSLYFRLIVEGARVLLLGCPSKVESIKDIEVLTKIVSSIALDNCMLMIL